MACTSQVSEAPIQCSLYVSEARHFGFFAERRPLFPASIMMTTMITTTMTTTTKIIMKTTMMMVITTTMTMKTLFLLLQIRSVFLLGEVSNASQQTALQQEHVQFGDLLQGHFLDSYHNLSHKGVMGFRWVSLHCARVRLVVKLDDDVFFDTFKLLYRYWGHIRDKKRSIFCSLWKAHTMQILRDGKWTVEEKIFRNRTTFPYNYCSGLTVMMTGDMMPALFSAAKVAPVFWIDDVYLYGILPAIASDVTFYDVGYRNDVMDLNWKRGLDCLKEKGHDCPLLAVSALREQLDAMWNETRALYKKNEWRIPAVQV